MLQGRRGEQERKKSRSVKVEGVLGSLLFSNTFFITSSGRFLYTFSPSLSLIAPSAVAAEAAAAAYILMKGKTGSFAPRCGARG